MVFPKELHWNMIFLVLSGKMMFLFPENIILFFRQKIKDDLSQKIHGNMIFSVYMYKCYKYEITFLSEKAKMIFSRKKYISSITEKDDIHPRESDIPVEMPY